MIPILDHDTRRLCITVAGQCAGIKLPATGLSFMLSRVGSHNTIAATADPMQADGRICMTLSESAYASARPGRYMARLVGQEVCNICVPIQIGARCKLAAVSTEDAPCEGDACEVTPSAPQADPWPGPSRKALRR